MDHTTFGFAARMAGGNIRAAQARRSARRPAHPDDVPPRRSRRGPRRCRRGRCRASRRAESLAATGYGFTGILVSFIARHNPIGILAAALLFGGLKTASSELQKYLLLPDASVNVLMGIVFVMVLSVETLYGRFKIFKPVDHPLEEPAPTMSGKDKGAQVAVPVV